MCYRIKLLLLFLCCVSLLKAQINPPQGSKLNYNQIMFEYDKVPDADSYTIQIAYQDSSGNFKRVIKEQKDNSTATLISNLQFGKKYMWRYAAFKHASQIALQGPYQFEIAGNSNSADNMKIFQCRVLKNDTAKNTGGLISLDYPKLIIDRKGSPVWYLPKLNKLSNQPGGTRDLKINNTGTVLFLTDNAAYESDLNGNILWQAPNNGKVSGDTTEYYHHDFKRLTNGNYMILGEKYMWKNVPAGADITKFRRENLDVKESVTKVKILFGTIIEYNKQGEVVWSWNSGDYFSDKDLFAKETVTNNPRRDLPADAEIFGHMNAFDIDSDGKFIYAGFRDVSRVIKIEKQTGKVMDSWGVKLPSGEANEGDDFFKNQHDVSIMPNNDILLFNNNGLRETNNTSSVVEFTQRQENKPSKITWIFDCKFDSLTNGKSIRNGGVDYLPNENFLICMGALGRVTEVVKSTKEIVWDAFFETKGAESDPWAPLALYRAHYSSSLYPCYFTVQSDKDSITSKSTSVNITLFNEGTDADSYTMNVRPSVAIGNKTLESGVILPGKSKSMIINLDMATLNTENCIIRITSKTNPDLIKRLTLKVVR